MMPSRILSAWILMSLLATVGLSQDTLWTPQHVANFAGALPYRKYPWPLRLMMRFIVSRAGGDTDTSRDYEYTDWNAVDRFAAEFAGRLSAP